MTAVIYELEADRLEVSAVGPEQPWDVGRVRLIHWHRNENGTFADQVFDVGGEAARDLAAVLLTAANEVAPEPVDVDGPALAYREGNRIRHADGRGYTDGVVDEQIRQHIASDEATMRQTSASIAFGHAVLELRQQERASGQVNIGPSRRASAT